MGHRSGRRIVTLLQTKKAELSDDDYAHLRKGHGVREGRSGRPATWPTPMASLTDEPGSRPDEGNLLYRPDGAASGAVAQPYGELPWLAR